MSIKLYGSKTSPYVRRIRILLENQDFQFELVDLYNDEARAQYALLNPLKKMPMLDDNGQKIFDSHVIADHIQQKFNLPKPTLAQLNLVSAVDAVTDSLIILFYGKRSEFEISKDKLIFQLQLERIPDVLTYLEKEAETGAFEQWHYASIALMTLINWIEFRSLYDLTPYKALLKAVDLHRDKAIVKETMPE
ncbi:glutathione S-transferase family protein [Catenovulum sp. 2E275]|uniref:glutathione S-transferase family protein n=1 Tax=Catenovulum sp. 2E275 TaxID=2980497 RepID=UPI0021D17620|nr:glutathione S-transferase family protein [Catenovulum sp. 2E275]MCU4675978.1 glutathione S-transferase family protein [Catenovulum sp. 2E275]